MGGGGRSIAQSTRWRERVSSARIKNATRIRGGQSKQRIGNVHAKSTSDDSIHACCSIQFVRFVLYWCCGQRRKSGNTCHLPAIWHGLSRDSSREKHLLPCVCVCFYTRMHTILGDRPLRRDAQEKVSTLVAIDTVAGNMHEVLTAAERRLSQPFSLARFSQLPRQRTSTKSPRRHQHEHKKRAGQNGPDANTTALTPPKI